MRNFLVFLLLTINYQLSTPLWAEMQGNTILDVSARMSRDLKTWVQEHLNRIFGFGKSEVFVQVDVGFSPTVRGDLERTLKSYLSGEATRSEAAAAAPGQGRPVTPFGDKLIITRFNMPNPIFELFKDPQFLSVVLKWTTIASLIKEGRG